MKVLILAGGFATRLWPLTENFPKPLLKVGGKPILSHILDRISNIETVDEIFVATNKKFSSQFSSWHADVSSFYHKKISLIIEESLKENEKLGSIGALHYALRLKNIDDDLLVVLGDNIFEFSLLNYVHIYEKMPFIRIGVIDLKNIELVRNFGVFTLDASQSVLSFKEKPTHPESTLASTGIYFFPRSSLPLIKEYIEKGNNPDKPGYLIEWLLHYKKIPLHGFVFKGIWFDIGTPETLKSAKNIYHSGRF